MKKIIWQYNIVQILKFILFINKIQSSKKIKAETEFDTMSEAVTEFAHTEQHPHSQHSHVKDSVTWFIGDHMQIRWLCLNHATFSCLRHKSGGYHYCNHFAKMKRENEEGKEAGRRKRDKERDRDRAYLRRINKQRTSICFYYTF